MQPNEIPERIKTANWKVNDLIKVINAALSNINNKKENLGTINWNIVEKEFSSF
jgi:hypothetical protein